MVRDAEGRRVNCTASEQFFSSYIMQLCVLSSQFNALINCKTHPLAPGEGPSSVRHVRTNSDEGVRQSSPNVASKQ